MDMDKDQREGFAKVADNLATASIIAIIAGGIVDHKIGFWATAALLFIFFVLLFVAFNLREEENKNGD